MTNTIMHPDTGLTVDLARKCLPVGFQDCREWFSLGLGNGTTIVAIDLHWIDETHLITKRQTRKQFRRSILDSWGWQCAYCASDLTTGATLDHIIPSSKGGLTIKRNLVACCLNCNVTKSDNPVWEWYRNQPFFSIDREKEIWKWHFMSTSLGSEHEHDRQICCVI